MSNLLGLSCLRSSASLAQAARSQAQLSSARSPRPPLDLLTGLTRCLSTRPSPKATHRRKVPVACGPIICPQWRSPQAPTTRQTRPFFGSTSSVITHYIHLPGDYKDATGLDFREGDGLTKTEALRIFPGTEMTPTRATKLLKIMHGRRVAGTLDDPSLRKNTDMFSQIDIGRALEYLRREIPVDEILNAGLRAEDELRALEEDAVTEDSGAVAVDEEESSAAKKAEKPDSVYGESIIDRIRAANIARAEAEERVEAEQRKKEEEAAAQNWGGITSYDPSLHRGLHPQQLEHYEAATSDLEAPPDTPRWRVLLPTTLFAAAVLASLYLTVTFVTPPRMASDLETKAAVGAIVALNVGVFIAWKRVRLWKFLNQHFILDFTTPRPHQILTAMTTHQDWRHLLKNLSAIVIGGSLLVPEIGAAPSAATYVASSVCGFLATLFMHVARRNQATYMFGSSAAGCGVICAYFWLYRFDGFKILGLPPDPLNGVQGLGIIGLFMAFFAVVPMVRRQGGTTGWLSHLVGMLTGIGCASMMERRWMMQKDLDAARTRLGEMDGRVEAAVADATKKAGELVEVKAANDTGKK